MVHSSRRYVMIAVMFVALMFSCMATTKKSPDGITFSGEMILTVKGAEKSVSGNETIAIPETLRVETQDDDPRVMAGIFAEERFYDKEAPVKVKTSKPFTVSGARVMGVFAIKTKGDGVMLESVGGKKSPFKVSAYPGDYYILIKNTQKEEKEQDEIDAAILLYVKITVEGK